MASDAQVADTRTSLVQATFDLTLANGVVPSLDAVVRESGVSKGGLLHHFPTRAALLRGLAQWLSAKSIAWFDQMCESDSAVDTWLAASTPKSEEMNDVFVLFTAQQELRAGGETGDGDYGAFLAHVDSRIAAELTGPDAAQRALMIRLVGDGLFFASLLGASVPDHSRAALAAQLTESTVD